MSPTGPGPRVAGSGLRKQSPSLVCCAATRLAHAASCGPGLGRRSGGGALGQGDLLGLAPLASVASRRLSQPLRGLNFLQGLRPPAFGRGCAYGTAALRGLTFTEPLVLSSPGLRPGVWQGYALPALPLPGLRPGMAGLRPAILPFRPSGSLKANPGLRPGMAGLRPAILPFRGSEGHLGLLPRKCRAPPCFLLALTLCLWFQTSQAMSGTAFNTAFN